MTGLRDRVSAAIPGLLILVAFAFMEVELRSAVSARAPDMAAAGPPLYLPSSRSIAFATLGHRTAVADLLYLWSIQYFSGSGPQARARQQWLAAVYDRITDLDPHFRDAYWMGFVSLLVEARDPEAAFALAEKAMVHEPGFTLIAIEAALTARKRGDRMRMVRYLEAASRAGNDPLAQRLLVRLQDARTAQDERAHWAALADSEDAQNRAIAAAYVRDLTVYIDTELLGALIDCFERRHGLPLASLEQLVTAGYLTEPWRDPEGEPYRYDAHARLVTSVSPSKHRQVSRAPDGVDYSGLGSCRPGSPMVGVSEP